MKSIALKAATLAVTLIAGLAVGEITLRLFTPFPITEFSNKQSHPVLGYVMDPAFHDIDSNGFRNRNIAIEEADLAIIGDSFAYGYNVSMEASFPSVIARKTGRKVYNFGIGGYGVYHYAALLDLNRDQKFRDVLVSLYLTNDLTGFCPTTSTAYWRDRAARESMELPECQAQEARRHGMLRRVADTIRKSASGSAFRHLVYGPLRQRFLKSSTADSDRFVDFPEGQMLDRKWLKFLRARQLENPTLALNFENSKVLFAQEAARYAERGVGFGFLFIPSPMLLMQEWSWKNGYDVPDEVAELAVGERMLADRYKEFFDSRDIKYTDALPSALVAFEREIAAGRDFYPITDDHPTEAGYESYADAAIEGMQL